MRITDDPANYALKQGLDLLSRRQQVTLQNIANVDTPGYKAKAVSFKEELAGLTRSVPGLAITHHGHLQELAEPRGLQVTELPGGGSWRNDGNSVDIDREMAQLAETTIVYSALTQQLASRLSLLRRVINEGRSA